MTAEAEAVDGWLAQQDGRATLSTNVSHRSFPDLTHDSLIESVNGATAASDAIVDAVMSVRGGTKLDGSTASQRAVLALARAASRPRTRRMGSGKEAIN